MSGGCHKCGRSGRRSTRGAASYLTLPSCKGIGPIRRRRKHERQTASVVGGRAPHRQPLKFSTCVRPQRRLCRRVAVKNGQHIVLVWQRGIEQGECHEKYTDKIPRCVQGKLSFQCWPRCVNSRVAVVTEKQTTTIIDLGCLTHDDLTGEVFDCNGPKTIKIEKLIQEPHFHDVKIPRSEDL